MVGVVVYTAARNYGTSSSPYIVVAVAARAFTLTSRAIYLRVRGARFVATFAGVLFIGVPCPRSTQQPRKVPILVMPNTVVAALTYLQRSVPCHRGPFSPGTRPFPACRACLIATSLRSAVRVTPPSLVCWSPVPRRRSRHIRPLLRMTRRRFFQPLPWSLCTPR